MIRTYAIAALVFLALDAVWLGVTGPRLYRPLLGALMRPEFDVLAAGAFYACYLAGLTHFAIGRARSVRDAAMQGAFFGFVAYATYDLTNQATLAAWRWQLTAIDLAWGATASAIASAVAWRCGRRTA
jgi:uncharacterized membrane protein